jgi:uncharacterized protein YaaW (UPF0174 family)
MAPWVASSAALGGTIIGGVLGPPSLLVWADGPAYRKTVPTVIMLLARTRVKLAQKQRAGERVRMA